MRATLSIKQHKPTLTNLQPRLQSAVKQHARLESMRRPSLSKCSCKDIINSLHKHYVDLLSNFRSQIMLHILLVAPR
jgi:hypothetical protein